jgi:hypothetical protein
MRDESIEAGLDVKVRKWFEKTGFPFEMWVARELRSAQFGIAPSAFVAGTVPGEMHEADVISWRGTQVGATRRDFTFYVCVECKKSAKKPWIVLSTAETHGLDPHWLTSLPCSASAQGLLNRISDLPELVELPMFAPSVEAGYSAVLGLHGGGEDLDKNYRATTALLQAVTAAKAKVRERPKHMDVDGPYVIAIPVVAVDGALFQGSLGPDGDPTLLRVKRSRVLWRREESRPGATVVHLVTKESIPAFVAEARQAFERLSALADKDGRL